MAVTQVGFHLPAKLDAVHLGHHDIADDHIDVVLLQQLQRFDAVPGREHRVAFRHLPPDEGAHLGIVLDDQHAVSLPAGIAALVGDALGILRRYGLHDRLRLLPAERNGQHEHIQFRVGLHRQRAVVQFGQRARQRQPDSRSG